MKSFVTLMIVGSLMFSPLTYGQRIKDLASVQGVRSNQLVGYGLVTNLN